MMASECGNIIQISLIWNRWVKPGTFSAKKLTQMVEQFTPTSFSVPRGSSFLLHKRHFIPRKMRNAPKGQIHLTGTFTKFNSLYTLCHRISGKALSKFKRTLLRTQRKADCYRTQKKLCCQSQGLQKHSEISDTELLLHGNTQTFKLCLNMSNYFC